MVNSCEDSGLAFITVLCAFFIWYRYRHDNQRRLKAMNLLAFITIFVKNLITLLDIPAETDEKFGSFSIVRTLLKDQPKWYQVFVAFSQSREKITESRMILMIEVSVF